MWDNYLEIIIKMKNKTELKYQKEQITAWAENNFHVFHNPNFITGLSNVVLETLFEPYYYEKKIYNVDNSTIKVVEFIEDIIEKAYGDHLSNMFMNFYNSLIKYLETQIKNTDTEYDLSFEYSKIVSYLKNKEVKDFNKFIIYINENIYQNKGGFING